jgi:hypothetical protein
MESYWACFGLYPSSYMWKTKSHNVSETRSVSVLRWMGQDKPTQLGPLERASLNPLVRNVVVFSLPHTRRWIKSKISPIALYSIHHHQNPFKSTCVVERYENLGIQNPKPCFLWVKGCDYAVRGVSNAVTECYISVRLSDLIIRRC